MRPGSVLKAALLLVAVTFPSSRGEECGDKRSSMARLTMDSRRNESGHWVSQVELVHGDAGERVGDAWTVDVHQRASSCSGATSGGSTARRNGFVVVGATLVSPRPGRANAEALAEAATEAEPTADQSIAEVQFGERLGDGLRLSRTELRWEQARRACQEHGQMLAIPPHASLTALHRLMSLQRVAMAWVGLRRSADGDVFRDPPGHAVGPSVRPMTSGEPVADACGAIQEDGRLNLSVSCEEPLPFFCQDHF